MELSFNLDPDSYRAILAAIPETVVVVDAQGTIRYMNRVEAGYEAEDVAGTSAFDYIESDFQDEYQEILERVFRTGASEEFEVAATGADGQREWYRSRIVPMKSEGRVSLAVAIVHNVTELRRLEEEAENLRKLLPICAWCKRVRDDEGYWEQVDRYLAQETGTRLTHSICPECEQRYSGDLPPEGGDEGRDGPQGQKMSS